ncbi:MAG: cation diffusion facilitator family transporter, partial [Actinomycetota bacterium]|nr:cation diffusion facilitator family transporter [Actinomycetota bacterium]
LSKANRSSLNIEGAFQHLLTDLYGFIATAIAGAVVLSTGFARADAIATLIVVALMTRAGVQLVRESGRIFLEAAPAGIDTRALGSRLAAHPDVVEVHDLHIWQITSGQPALSAHVLVQPGLDCHAVRTDLQALLAHDYAITHVTLQLDHPAPELFTITHADRADEKGHCADLPAPGAENNT